MTFPSDLAPESRAILEMAAELGLLEHDVSTVAGLRALTRAEAPLIGEGPEVGEVRDRELESASGPLPIRIYRPVEETSGQTILWMHGGGWVIGDIEAADGDCRALCAETASTVVSVGYRLAPEHPFPAGLEDAYTALAWVASTSRPSRLVVGGESAGGNLAAALCLMARERGGPRIDAQVLIYPVADRDCDTDSYRRFAEDYGLTRELMLRFWDLYTGGDAEAGRHPFASVLLAPDLRGLPPATVVLAGCDVLRDEGEAYAERLLGAGVPVEVLRYPGQIHGFWTYRGASAIPAEVDAAIGSSLKRG